MPRCVEYIDVFNSDSNFFLQKKERREGENEHMNYSSGKQNYSVCAREKKDRKCISDRLRERDFLGGTAEIPRR